jgi:hypothetical protein
MMNPKTIDRTARPERRRTRRCNICSKATQGGKFHCTNHIEAEPYVQGVMARIAAKAAEEADIKKRGYKAVDINGINVKEILVYLNNHGDVTLQRLAKDTNRATYQQKQYVIAMKKAGLVRTGYNSRNSLIVRAI